ncbi:GATA-binding transcription factor [Cavenderia fasciculata]|uniref:GATA-binding transcription factor n=1 Tax=Cavenderia fasciculata TaxID=261658 RepID=F4PSH9_CACFS|nr:GATA-binding transcription factor [Cavenderia fasciculata]EGG21509.1 GATA-binding transcription factor [Cavenderia fasciculata]|eukprot:XP_004359359.1 GATA-binding transcription factor [Cavenderia fasciculata]
MTSPMQPYPHHMSHHIQHQQQSHHSQLQQQQMQSHANRQPILLSALQWEQIQKISYIIHEFATEAYTNISTNLDDLCNMTTVLNQLISDINTDSHTKYLQQQQHYNMEIDKNKMYYDGGSVGVSMISIPSHSLGANAPGMAPQQQQQQQQQHGSSLNIKTDPSLTYVGNGSSSTSSSPMANTQTKAAAIAASSSNGAGGSSTAGSGSSGATPVSNIDSQKNFNGEIYFDDPLIDKPRRRRRTVYSAKRNLKCQHCNVTETPEWRRGPNGDHTLCNACGLHYAKTLKKQNKEKERIEKEKAAKAAAEGTDQKDNNNNNNNNASPPSTATTPTPPTNVLKSPTSSNSSSPQTSNSLVIPKKDVKMSDISEQSININLAASSPPPIIINKKHSIDFVMDNPFTQSLSSSSGGNQVPIQPIPQVQQQQQQPQQPSYMDHQQIHY